MPRELRGVDTIPEAERTSGPRDLVSILLGSNLCLGVIVFGWLPPSFGLDWWSSVTSVVAGTVVGTLFTAPLALVSLRTATNLSTSSGAQFGVRGRLVGSVVGLLLALGYTALTVWIGGDVMVGVLGRLFGLPADGTAYTVVYALLAAATVAGAVYGYRVLLAMSRVLAFGMTALLVLGVFAYAPHFTTEALPETGGYLLDGYWPTWLLAAVAAGLSGPIAFITLLGDYTRYISPPLLLPARAAGDLAGADAGAAGAAAVRHVHGVRGPRRPRLRRAAGRRRARLVPDPAAAGRVRRVGGERGADAVLDGARPGRDPAARVPHDGDLRRRGGRDGLRLRRAPSVDRAGRDDVVRAAAHGRGDAVGGDHPDRLGPLPGVYDADALQVFNRRARAGRTGTRPAGTSRRRRPGPSARSSASWPSPCPRTRGRWSP